MQSARAGHRLHHATPVTAKSSRLARHSIKVLVALGLLAPSMFAVAGGFSMYSPDIKQDGQLQAEQVFNGLGCAGKNTSPALAWRNVPAGTKSFAVTVYDPDAPTGSGWWHWVVVNLPATATGLAKASGNLSGDRMPAGAVQVRTDFGQAAFGGACPPAGDKPHRYIFTVFALKTEKIELPAEASAAFAGYMIHANAIDKASLTTTYGR